MVLGGLLVAGGAAWIHPPSGVIVVGVELILGAVFVAAANAAKKG